MPPKAKITKETILQAILKIIQTVGFNTVGVRSIANHLQCSTRLIFTCYQDMEELKISFLSFAYEYYEQFATNHDHSGDVSPYLLLSLSYIALAQEEAHLFKLLFIHDMDLSITEAGDFYREIDNEKRAKAFSETIDIESEHVKIIFLDLFLYTHGIVVLVATKKFILNRADTEAMVQSTLTAFIRRGKSDWDLSL